MARVQAKQPDVSSRLRNARSSRARPITPSKKAATPQSPIKQPPPKTTATANAASKPRGRPAKITKSQDPKQTNVPEPRTSRRATAIKEPEAPSTPRSTRSSNPATPVHTNSNAKKGRSKDVKKVADDLLREIQSEPVTPRSTRSAPATPQTQTETSVKKGRGRPTQAQKPAAPSTPQTRSNPLKKVSFDTKAVPGLKPQINGTRRAGRPARAVPKHASPLKRSAATKATLARKSREKQASRPVKKAASSPKKVEPERKSTRKILATPKMRSQAAAKTDKQAEPVSKAKRTKPAAANGLKRKAEPESAKPAKKRVRRTRDALQAEWEAQGGAPFVELEGDFENEVLVDDVRDVEHRWAEVGFTEVEEEVEDTAMVDEPSETTQTQDADGETTTNGIISAPEAVTTLADTALGAIKHIPSQITDAVHAIEETVSSTVQSIEHGLEAVGRAFSRSPEETRHDASTNAQTDDKSADAKDESQPALTMQVLDVVPADEPAAEGETEGLIDSAGESIENIVEKVQDVLPVENGSSAIDSVKETVSNVVDTIEDAAGTVADALTQKVDGASTSPAEGEGEQVAGFAEVATHEPLSTVVTVE